jgi:hypothetical protein
MQLKKHGEVRNIVFTIGKPIHFPTFSLPLTLEEKDEATQKDGDKIEELEQSLFELHRKIGGQRACPVYAYSR